jgi:glycosyltransferase involved in cell wall biosynthesis
MKRLLVLTPRFPYPVIGGDRLRIDRLCKELAQHFSLTLASLCEDPAELHYEPPAGIFIRVERVYLPKWRSRLNCVGSMFHGAPLQVAYYRSKRFAKMVDKLLPEHDGVLCHLIRTAEYARNASMPRFLEMTDAISMNYSRIQRGVAGDLIKRIIYGFERSKLSRYETSVSRDFDCSFLVSPVDLHYLTSDDIQATTLYRVAGNGVDCEDLPFRFTDAGTRLCFIGNMTTMQNLDAANYFARDIFPIVLRAVPNARFKIVGRMRERERRRFSRFSCVDVTGEVRSIVDATDGASVGVCPMRVGAGVQNKVLEYMALGIPAVVSSIALEGLGARNGQELLVEDSPEQFALAVIKLIQNRSFALRIAEAGRNYVESNHSWHATLAPVCETLDRKLSEK